jgi:hypothetical protein
MKHSVTQTQIGLLINIVTLFIDELADLFFKRETERKKNTHTIYVRVCNTRTRLVLLVLHCTKMSIFAQK